MVNIYCSEILNQTITNQQNILYMFKNHFNFEFFKQILYERNLINLNPHPVVINLNWQKQISLQQCNNNYKIQLRFIFQKGIYIQKLNNIQQYKRVGVVQIRKLQIQPPLYDKHVGTYISLERTQFHRQFIPNPTINQIFYHSFIIIFLNIVKMYTIERQNLRYIEHSHHNLIQDVEFFIPKEHQDFLSELESLIELPNDDSSSPKRQIPKQKKIKKLQKVVKEQKVKTKNFFTNIGTYLKHYMHKKCNQKELAMFFSIFGRKRSYKSMKKFSNLFASPLQKYCIQFFTTEVLKQFIKSNTADKSLLIKYLAVLRQGAIKGQINILKY